MTVSTKSAVENAQSVPNAREGTSRAHGLDALRGLAATGVVFTHAVAIHPLGVPHKGWSVEYFSMGVPLFFILSAFTMSWAYPKGVSFKRAHAYALRRFFRIAPLFYAMLAAWLWLGVQADTGTILRNLTFVFGLVPSEQVSLVPAGWSIGVEAIFYVLFPFIFFWRHIWAAIIVLIASFIGWGIINLPPLASEVPHFYYWTNFFTNAPYFAMGLLAWCVYQLVPTSRDQIVSFTCLFAGIGLLLVTFVWGPLLDSAAVSIDPVSIEIILGWGLGFTLIVLSQALHPVRVLVNPVTTFLGKISYSLYLTHPFLIYATDLTRWAATLTDNPSLVVPIVCAITLSVALPLATLVHYLVEYPFMRAARFMTRQSN